MNKKLHFIFLLCLIPWGIVTAQQSKKVTGKISDTNGAALPGVTISLKSTSTPLTSSNQNGAYEVNAKEGDVLIFSLIGYTRVEKLVTAQSQLNVALTNDQNDLNEVVVVGYGTQRKGNMTGSVSVIESGQLERRPNLSTSAALQGLAPGVTVTQQTGSPGGDAGQIRIRGINSFGGSDSSPLVVIDGVAGSIDNIDYNLVENITVLKDAASAAIYGSRAANGVILITTKRGKDKLLVDYKGYTGFQKPTAIPEVTDGFTYMRVFNEANANDGSTIPLYSENDIEAFRKLYEADPSNFDWQDAILQGSGFTQNHFLGLSANTGIIRVAPSFSYATQNGVIDNTGLKRYTFRNNMDITPSEKFNIKLDLAVTNRDRLQIASEGTIWNYLGRMPTIIPIRRNGLWSEGWVTNNPVAFIEEGGNRKNNNLEFYGNLSLNYKPVEWLNLVGTVAPRYETFNDHIFTKRVETYNDDGSVAGAANVTELEENARRKVYGNYFLTATAEKKFGDHDFKLMGGASRESYNEKYLMGSRRDYIYTNYEVLNAGGNNETKNNEGSVQDWLLVSTFGRFNYAFKDRYLFEANIRYDGSSRFTGNNQWAVFPSFSAGWRVSEESFMEGLRNQVNQLKFRGSWGKLGNQNIGSSYYPFSSPLEVGGISMGDKISPVITQNVMANPDLIWEETTMTGLGLDAVLFNKFSLTFDWYSKTTDGILMKLYISQLYGLAPPFQNAGKVSNKGWELSARYDNKFNNGIKLGIGFNLSDVKNRIIDMRDSFEGTFLRQQEGYAVNSIYGYIADGYYQTAKEIASGPIQFDKLQPGDIRYKDFSGAFDANGNPIGDGRVNDADKTIIGSTIPRYTYGANLDLGYKGFKLSAFLQGVGKVDGYLNSHYVMPTVNVSSIKPWQLDYWTPDNRDAILPRLSIASTNNTQNSTFWMRSAAYMRLKNVQLGYELPKNLLAGLKIASAYIYVNGQNLFTKTNFYEGYDPEVNYDAGAGEGVALGGGNYYPQVKVYTFGIDLKF